MVLSFGKKNEATFKDGCLSLRKSVLDKMRAKNAPGPIYNPKSCVSSTEKIMFRNITFGTGPARYVLDNIERYLLIDTDSNKVKIPTT